MQIQIKDYQCALLLHDEKIHNLKLETYNLGTSFHKNKPTIWWKNKGDALSNLVSVVQFKKRENYSWRSVTFNKVAGYTK